MDEFERELGQLRPDPVPEAQTVARHADQLRAVIAQEALLGPGAQPRPGAGVDGAAPDRQAGPDHDGRAVVPVAITIPLDGQSPRREAESGRGGRGGPSRGRLVAAVAAAVVVVAGGVAAAMLAGGDDEPLSTGQPGVDPVQETAPPPAANLPSELPCGTELPINLPMPAGYEGPTPGLTAPEPGFPEPPAGSYAVHWEGPGGTIDVRWPAARPIDPEVPHDSPLTADWEMDPWTTADGRTAFGVVFESLRVGRDACVGVDVVAVGPDFDSAETLFENVERALIGPGGPFAIPDADLVTAESEADELPRATPCPADDPEGPIPDSGSPVEGGDTYATPREALGYFLATESYLSHSGWEEVTVADGSVAYAHDADGTPGDHLNAVIHVTHDSDGWTVVGWEGYGCSR